MKLGVYLGKDCLHPLQILDKKRAGAGKTVMVGVAV